MASPGMTLSSGKELSAWPLSCATKQLPHRKDICTSRRSLTRASLRHIAHVSPPRTLQISNNQACGIGPIAPKLVHPWESTSHTHPTIRSVWNISRAAGLWLQITCAAATLEAEPLARRIQTEVESSQSRRVQSFEGLQSDDVRHPLDAQNTRMLRRLPGLDFLAKSLMGDFLSGHKTPDWPVSVFKIQKRAGTHRTLGGQEKQGVS